MLLGSTSARSRSMQVTLPFDAGRGKFSVLLDELQMRDRRSNRQHVRRPICRRHGEIWPSPVSNSVMPRLQSKRRNDASSSPQVPCHPKWCVPKPGQRPAIQAPRSPPTKRLGPSTRKCYEAAFGAAASASAIGAFEKAKEWLMRAQPGMGDTLPWLLSVIDVELNARDPKAALSQVNA